MSLPGFVGLAPSSASEAPDTAAPTGDPTNASAFSYASTYVGVQWTNADTSALTQIGYSVDIAIEPSSATWTAGAGVTSWETGTENRCYWWVRHYRNGQVGSWVSALHPGGCTPGESGGTGGGGTGDEGSIEI